MKKFFKNVSLISVLSLFAISCSEKNEEGVEVNKGTKDVTIRIASTTYATEATATGKKPTLFDASIYFIKSNGDVYSKEEMTKEEIKANTKTVNNVPGDIEKIIIVGNNKECTSPVLPSTLPATEADLMKIMLEHAAQTNPETHVNLLGVGNIIFANNTFTAKVVLKAAVARIEISGVKTKDTGAAIPLESFKLAGIFINNTYLKLGMDYTTKPTAAADIINYSYKDANAFTDGSFKTKANNLCDIFNYDVAKTFAPGSNNFWSYFIMPPVATANGTSIEGSGAQTAVPHIILHLTNVTAVDNVNNKYPAANYFVTISTFNTTDGALNAFEAGRVYKLANPIEIGGEHLSDKPERPTQANLEVTVEVKEWEETQVTPGL